jgi:hypothetical protein
VDLEPLGGDNIREGNYGHHVRLLKKQQKKPKRMKEGRLIHAGNEVSLDKVGSALAYDVVCTYGVTAGHVS